jgi:peptidoglycan/LPS O-acetylase OafA/YrhL
VHVPVTEVLGWNLYRWGLDTPAEMVLVTVPVVVAASLAAGQLFHRVVERRFLNPPHRPLAHAATPAASPGQPQEHRSERSEPRNASEVVARPVRTAGSVPSVA